jgi:hypothetical protein
MLTFRRGLELRDELKDKLKTKLSKKQRKITEKRIRNLNKQFNSQYRSNLRKTIILEKQSIKDPKLKKKYKRQRAKFLKLSRLLKRTYRGTVVIQFNIYANNVLKKRKKNIIFNVKNKTRAEILEEIKDRAKIEMQKVNIPEHYDKVIKYELVDIKKSLPLGFLMKESEFKNINIGKINEQSSINNYLESECEIDDELRKEYEKYNFKNCYIVFVLNKLLRRNGDKHYYNFEQVLKDGVPKNGVFLKDIDEHMKYIDCSYYIIGNYDEIIQFYSSTSNKFKPLFFSIRNNHIYPIYSRFKRKSITSKARQKRIYKQKISKDKKFVQYDLTEKMNEYLRNGQVPKHKFINGKFQRVANLVHIDYDTEPVLKACETLKLDKCVIKSNVLQSKKKHFPSSTLNKGIRDIFSLVRKGGEISRYKDTEFIKNNLDKIHSLDMTKCFWSILMDRKLKMPIFGPTCKIEKVNITSYRDIENYALYYVKTQDTSVLHRTNWYYGFRVINLFYEEGIKYKIKYRMRPSVAIKNDSKSIKFFRDLYKNDDIPMKLRKELVCQFIGTFRTNQSTYEESQITDNTKTVRQEILKNDVLALKYEVNNIPYWVMKKQVNTYKKSTHQFISYLIIDKCASLVYTKMKQLRSNGYVIVEKKVDSIKFVGNPDIFEKKENVKPGQFGLEEFNKESLLRPLRCTYIRPKVRYKHITYFKPTHNHLFYGSAGTGKSYSMLDKKFDLAASYTNIAVFNLINIAKERKIKIETKTLTKLLGSKNIESGNLAKLNQKKIMIDEVYCTPYQVLHHIYLHMEEGIHFIGAGDKHQLTLNICEDSKKVDLYMIEELIPFMFPIQTKLTKQYRFDKNDPINKWISDPKKPDIEKVKKLKKIPINNKCIHICYTNRKRNEINKKYITKKIHKDNESLYISLENRDEYVRNQMVTYAEIKKNNWPIREFQIGSCLTSHKSQGLTIKKKRIILHEVKEMKDEPRLAYVAMSRCKKSTQLRRV